jgi:hypothetical protein
MKSLKIFALISILVVGVNAFADSAPHTLSGECKLNETSIGAFHLVESGNNSISKKLSFTIPGTNKSYFVSAQLHPDSSNSQNYYIHFYLVKDTVQGSVIKNHMVFGSPMPGAKLGFLTTLGNDPNAPHLNCLGLFE